METKSFKLKFRDEFRRVQLAVSNHDVLFATLWTKAQEITNGTPFVLQYQDNEGDFITIDQKEEVPDLLMEFADRTIILQISPQNHPADPEPKDNLQENQLFEPQGTIEVPPPQQQEPAQYHSPQQMFSPVDSAGDDPFLLVEPISETLQPELISETLQPEPISETLQPEPVPEPVSTSMTITPGFDSPVIVEAPPAVEVAPIAEEVIVEVFPVVEEFLIAEEAPVVDEAPQKVLPFAAIPATTMSPAATTTTTTALPKSFTWQNPFAVLSFLFSVLTPAYQSNMSESSRKLLPTLCASLTAAVMADGSSYCGYDVRQLCGVVKSHSEHVLAILCEPAIGEAIGRFLVDFNNACDTASGLNQLIGRVICLLSDFQLTLQLPEAMLAGLESCNSSSSWMAQSMMTESVVTIADNSRLSTTASTQHDTIKHVMNDYDDDSDDDNDHMCAMNNKLCRVYPNDDDDEMPLLTQPIATFAHQTENNNSNPYDYHPISPPRSPNSSPTPFSASLSRPTVPTFAPTSPTTSFTPTTSSPFTLASAPSPVLTHTPVLVATNDIPAVPALQVLQGPHFGQPVAPGTVLVPSWRVRNCGGSSCSRIMLMVMDNNPMGITVGQNNAFELSQGRNLQPGEETSLAFTFTVPRLSPAQKTIRARFLPFDHNDETILCDAFEVEIQVNTMDPVTAAMHELNAMGFTNSERNRFLLRQNNNDVSAVVQRLLDEALRT